MEVVKRIPNMRPKYLLEQKGENNLRRERLQEFNLRISQASKTELIVIMYDIVLEDIECAKEALDTGDEKTYLHDLKHAQRFLNELMANLNYTYSISYSLCKYRHIRYYKCKCKYCRKFTACDYKL